MIDHGEYGSNAIYYLDVDSPAFMRQERSTGSSDYFFGLANTLFLLKEERICKMTTLFSGLRSHSIGYCENHIFSILYEHPLIIR